MNLIRKKRYTMDADDADDATDEGVRFQKSLNQNASDWWIWILFYAGVLIGVLAIIQLIRLAWKRLSGRNKLHKEGLQKPLTLHPRKPTTAIKSPASGSATGGNVGATHYLKKSPSPTAVSPSTDKSSSGGGGGLSPSSASTKESSSPKDSSTSDGITSSGPSLAEDSLQNNGAIRHNSQETGKDVTDENNGNLLKVDDGSKNVNRIITKQDILNGYLGQLFFSVRYKKEKNVLLVTIIKCQNLPSKDTMGINNDPYVKLQLLPEKQHKVKTRVLRKTRNPVYDEDFSFYGIKFHQLPSITLHFIVLTFDRYSRDEVIGEVFFSLKNVDLSEENTNITFQENIQPRKVKDQGRGELLVSLCYQPAANRLTVVILKSRNLPKMDVTGLADPYVKIYLMYKGQRIAKKKTHVKKRTLNPVFNESFVFEIPATPDGLDCMSLEFMVLDWDRVTKNEVIGRLEMGKQCEYQSSPWQHWTQVCNCPRRQIADWHKLFG